MTNIKKILTSIGLVATVLLAPLAFAATDSQNVSLSVSVGNVAPSVSSLSLSDMDGNGISTGSTLNPVAEGRNAFDYQLSFTVSDNNGLSDLNKIIIEVYYDSIPGSTEEHTYAKFTGTVNADGSISWSASPSGGGWKIQTVDGVNTGVTSDTVKVKIGIGDVAKEDTSNSKWYFKVTVTDKDSSSDSATLGGYKMAAFVDLSVSPTSLSFSLTPGQSSTKSVTGVITSNDAWTVSAKLNSSPSLLSSVKVNGVAMSTSAQQIDSGSGYTSSSGTSKTWNVVATAKSGVEGSESLTLTITANNP